MPELVYGLVSETRWCGFESHHDYMKCTCGETCSYDDRQTPDQPCWGEVNIVDYWDIGDDEIRIHACEGHSDMVYGGEYKPKSM